MGIQYSLSASSITPTGTADAANLVDSTYLGVIQGGTTTQVVSVDEVYMGGLTPTTSSPTDMVLAMDSTVATGAVAGGRNAKTNPASTAPGTLPLAGITVATTKPQRSSTLHVLHLPFNACGGIVRWQPAIPGFGPSLVGNAVNLGEMSLSAMATGTPGIISSHILYEIE
jgi:hypothetical protein